MSDPTNKPYTLFTLAGRDDSKGYPEQPYYKWLQEKNANSGHTGLLVKQGYLKEIGFEFGTHILSPDDLDYLNKIENHYFVVVPEERRKEALEQAKGAAK